MIACLIALLILISTNDHLISAQPENETCQATSSQFYDYLNWGYMHYHDFRSLSEVNFECDLSILSNSKHRPFVGLLLEFNGMKLVNETIPIHLFSFQPITVHILKVKGFEISRFLLTTEYEHHIQNSYEFSQDTFDFYYKGSLIDSSMCNAEYFEDVEIPFFSNLRYSDVMIFLNSNQVTAICPYVFKNADIQSLTFTRLQNNKLNKQTIMYLKIVNNKNNNINIK